MADSPDNRVMEATSGQAEIANRDIRRKNDPEWARRQDAKESLSEGVGGMKETFGAELAAAKPKLVGPEDASKPVLPHHGVLEPGLVDGLFLVHPEVEEPRLVEQPCDLGDHVRADLVILRRRDHARVLAEPLVVAG